MNPPSRVNDRSVSPVISVILVVAITVVLAATISVFVLGIGEKLQDPGPNVAESSGAFVGPDGFEGGVVRITHEAGDRVAVENMEIAVTAPCGDARIVNLPAEGGNTPKYTSNPYEDRNLEGDDIISQGINFETPWSAGVLHESTEDTFTAGDSFEFRLRTGCSLSVGDTVTVRVIHTPTNSITIEEELRVN